MRLSESHCQHCGAYQPARELAADEVCACGSQFCLLRSVAVCITTNLPRPGTFRRSEREAKSPAAPPRDTMLRTAAVRK